MKKRKRIFAGAPSEQAQQTKKEVLSGKCLRTQHDKETGRRSFFKAADGIIAALKKRSALPVHANNPRAAFTLAEVLITLTIIGVIAAITVPALIQRTNKQEYVSALQKAYSTLSQATQAIIAAEGSPKGEDSWLQDVDSFYETYKKYLVNAKDCGSGTGCFGQQNYKFLNNTVHSVNFDSNAKIRKLILADGMQLMFGSSNLNNTCSKTLDGTNNVCAYMSIDVNGEKGPNTYGRDVFEFDLKENGLYPAGCDDETECRRMFDGRACTCKVLREGKIDY